MDTEKKIKGFSIKARTANSPCVFQPSDVTGVIV